MIDHNDRFFRRAWCCAGLVIGMAGCSAESPDGLPREPVSGVVTLDGQPLAEGLIRFRPLPSGPTEGGTMITDGSFSIDRASGLVPGTYGVYINATEKPAAKDASAEFVPPGGRVGRPPRELVPAKYNSKSDLKIEIKKGGSNQSLEWSLSTK